MTRRETQSPSGQRPQDACAGRRRAALAALVLLGLAGGAAGCRSRGDKTQQAPAVDSAPPANSGGTTPGAAASALSTSTAVAAASVAAEAVLPREIAADRVGADDEVVLLFGGDVNFGRGTGQRLLREPEYQPLRFMKPVFASADFRFVNLESQLSDQQGVTQSKHSRLVFTGPPGGAATLKSAGVDLVSVANNHMWDFGKSALLETLVNLDRAGVRYVGASAEPGKQAYQPVSVEVRGLKIAVFAVTHIWNQGPINEHPGRHYVAWADYAALKPLIAAAKRSHDVVILSYHGGAEYVDAPMTWTRDFVRAVMRAGVDAVIGHHPHVPQGVGWADSRPVFYSLGNLVFPMHSDHVWTGTSFLARLTWKKPANSGARPELSRVEACPYFILGHAPKPFEGKARGAREAQFRHHLGLTSRSVGGSVIGPSAADGCIRINPPGLTGPGAPLHPLPTRRPAASQGTP